MYLEPESDDSEYEDVDAFPCPVCGKPCYVCEHQVIGVEWTDVQLSSMNLESMAMLETLADSLLKFLWRAVTLRGQDAVAEQAGLSRFLVEMLGDEDFKAGFSPDGEGFCDWRSAVLHYLLDIAASLVDTERHEWTWEGESMGSSACEAVFALDPHAALQAVLKVMRSDVKLLEALVQEGPRK